MMLRTNRFLWKTTCIKLCCNFLSQKLSGKVAIVTGSTSGIGLATARRLAEDGAAVVISSRRQENVDRAVSVLQKEGLDVDGVVCHVGDPEQRKALVDHTVRSRGGIDIFVSPAGVNPAVGPMLNCPDSAWDKIFDVNVKAAFVLSKLIVPEMMKRKGGSIVYISSISAYQPFSFIGAYSVSKTALLGLTVAMAKECSQYNIRVNCVAPGFIDTPFSKVLKEREVAWKVFEANAAVNRMGRSEEVAPMISFLCSEDASYITGQNISVNGGIFTGL